MHTSDKYCPKIKICGLFREEDIEAVNEAKPDYCGFVIDYPKSHRSITAAQAYELRKKLDDGIVPVGVFVNKSSDEIAELFDYGVIEVAQLHGDEDETYIDILKSLAPDKEIWKAFIIKIGSTQSEAEAVLKAAQRSLADMVLLDAGFGYGEMFEHSFAFGFKRPFILAGGITPENVSDALWSLKPYGVDISSGVETDNLKDRKKIIEAVRLVKDIN